MYEVREITVDDKNGRVFTTQALLWHDHRVHGTNAAILDSTGGVDITRMIDDTHGRYIIGLNSDYVMQLYSILVLKTQYAKITCQCQNINGASASNNDTNDTIEKMTQYIQNLPCFKNVDNDAILRHLKEM